MLKVTNLIDKLRAQTVKRWTVVHTTKQQSLAEHSFNVAMIAREICLELEISPVVVMQVALVHDLEEILTGDIPSPFKRYAESRSMAINDLSTMELDLQLSSTEKLILKAADNIENTWFIQEFAAGRHAEQVAKEQLAWFQHQYMHVFTGETFGIGLAVEKVAAVLIDGNYKAWPAGEGLNYGNYQKDKA